MNGCKKFWGEVGTDAGSVWNTSVARSASVTHVAMANRQWSKWKHLFVVGDYLWLATANK